jgi:photosystem II stability/assembly factor-like uncharacterized protein
VTTGALLFLAVLLPALPVVAASEAFADEEISKVENVEARMRARRMRRVDPTGEIAPGAILRAREQLEARLAEPSPAGPQDAGIWNWEWLGPGNIGGRVRALVFHPTDSNVMWLGSAGGGVWKTTNGGGQWTPMSDFLSTLPVASLAVDPINPQILYAGTGELVGSNSSIPGSGIWKSIDGGLNWFLLTATSGVDFSYVSTLEHNRTVSGRLLAGTRTGIYRSNDGGSNWTLIFDPPGNVAVRDITWNPANASIIAAGTETDMYLSPDGGTTWVRQTTGAAGKMPASPGSCEIAFAPSNTNYIYVQVGNDVPVVNDLSDPIYRSTDGGATWTFWNPTNADRWSNAIWVSPTDPTLLVWGGFGDLYRSLGSGSTGFTRISSGSNYNAGLSAHTDQHVILSHPGFNGATNWTIFVANDGGVQKAVDVRTAGQTSGWTNLANNLGVSQFFGGAAAIDGSVILGGTQDNGSLDYRPGGGPQGWVQRVGGDGVYAAIEAVSNPSRLFLAQAWLAILRSDNGGSTWQDKVSGLTDAYDGTKCDFLAPMVMDPNNSAVLLAGSVRIWRTTNSADAWSSIRGSTTGNPFCTAIDIAKSNSSVIWVGYANGLVSHTLDGGGTWFDHVLPTGSRPVTDIAVNPAAYNEAFVTVGGYSNQTVLYTNTTGASWQIRNGTAPYDLPDIQVNTVRYHPLQTNWIYVGTDMGVFASEDKGLTWTVTPTSYSGNDGPNNVEVDELFWQGTTSLIAATHGRGMYRVKPLPIVYVDKLWNGFENGTEAFPYNTVQEAAAAYGPGALISIKSNTYEEPILVFSKRGVIRATGGTVRIQ